jgi:purine-cytosine permease-like protein
MRQPVVWEPDGRFDAYAGLLLLVVVCVVLMSAQALVLAVVARPGRSGRNWFRFGLALACAVATTPIVWAYAGDTVRFAAETFPVGAVFVGVAFGAARAAIVLIAIGLAIGQPAQTAQIA